MYLQKWLPLFAPEELGVDPGTEAPRVPINERPADGPGSGRGEIRKHLEKSFEDSRQEPAEVKPKARAKRAGVNNQPVEEPVEEPVEQEVEGTELEVKPAVAAPKAWAEEAKAEWEKLPPAVHAAVIKREADMSRGVDALKAQYNELDKVLQPRRQTIKAHGHTDAQAVNQLFAWFEALTANPQQTFPALAQSFKFDLKSLFPGVTEPVKEQPKVEGGQPVGEIPAPVQNYINEIRGELTALKQGVQQQFGNMQNTFAQQSYQKTEEILGAWAKNKPHYEEVRGLMAHLIGSGAVAALPNGSADLDTAYDMALYAMPEVRQKVLADQKAAADAETARKATAERQAQQVQADKARRAATLLGPSAPGSPVDPKTGKKKGKSVRESIADAMEEVRT